MTTFEYIFRVAAPQREVLAFHHDSSVLKRLMPPPLFVQLHEVDPLGEGATADFTLWFGPVPVRWRAYHFDVSQSGFSDRQLQGPLHFWEHTHRFEALDSDRTLVSEQVTYKHHPGPRGLLTRLLFNRPGLTVLFTYRQIVTRWHLEPAFRHRLALLALPLIAYLLWRAIGRGQPRG